MKLQVVIFYLFIGGLVQAQTTTLSIMGNDSYIEYAEAYSVKLRFEEDPSKCDPIVGFVSLEDQIKHFSESLVAAQIMSKPEASNIFIASEYPTKEFTLLVSEEDQLIEAIRLAKEQRVQITKIYYVYPEHSYKEEDGRAVRALLDAKLKANIYAAHIGMKVNRILRIDDETSEASNPFNEGDERYESYNALLGRLSNMSTLRSSDYFASSRSRGYNLWVEFELVGDQ